MDTLVHREPEPNADTTHGRDKEKPAWSQLCRRNILHCGTTSPYHCCHHNATRATDPKLAASHTLSKHRLFNWLIAHRLPARSLPIFSNSLAHTQDQQHVFLRLNHAELRQGVAGSSPAHQSPHSNIRLLSFTYLAITNPLAVGL